MHKICMPILLLSYSSLNSMEQESYTHKRKHYNENQLHQPLINQLKVDIKEYFNRRNNSFFIIDKIIHASIREMYPLRTDYEQEEVNQRVIFFITYSKELKKIYNIISAVSGLQLFIDNTEQFDASQATQSYIEAITSEIKDPSMLESVLRDLKKEFDFEKKHMPFLLSSVLSHTPAFKDEAELTKFIENTVKFLK